MSLGEIKMQNVPWDVANNRYLDHFALKKGAKITNDYDETFFKHCHLSRKCQKTLFRLTMTLFRSWKTTKNDQKE